MLVAGKVNTLPRYRPKKFVDPPKRRFEDVYKRRIDWELVKMGEISGQIIGYLDNPSPLYISDMDDANFDEAVSAARFEKKEMFEYHMYDLPRHTTIKNNQSKQIKLLETQGIDMKNEYIITPAYLSTWAGDVALFQDDYDYFSARIRRASTNRNEESEKTGPLTLEGHAVKQEVAEFFTFKNTEDNSLGNPLPAGKVMIYSTSENGKRLFLGETTIPHTPSDEELRLRVGQAHDIIAERSLVNFKKGPSKSTETEWEITVRNRREKDVNVRIEENASGEWEILESTHKHIKKDAETFVFEVAVGEGGEVVVRYRIRGEGRQ
jgi:hypothetical protein